MMLRTGTTQAHREAESGVFVRSILDGTVDREAYGKFLWQLKAIYAAIEQGLAANQQDPRIAPVALPQVYRLAALETDLAFYGVKGSELLEPTKRYVAEVVKVSKDAPHRLAAHAYTRYLGDLSGGQGLKKCIQKAFSLTGSDGVAFYEFGGIDDFNGFKAQYRVALDGLPLNETEKHEAVEEAVLAFQLNGAITRELAGGK